jgi:putative acetyltransferase
MTDSDQPPDLVTPTPFSGTLRPSVATDMPEILQIYPLAFPDEDLRGLIKELIGRPDVASLVATIGGAVAGHVLFTRGQTGNEAAPSALLGPLAVTPAWQRSGIGSALILKGLENLKEAGVRVICVLGDPAYYKKFGFKVETGIIPPCPIPDTWRPAWQSLDMTSDADPVRGRLSLPEPWLRPWLWTE